MILWRLRGYRDPEGEWEGGVAECALERTEDGYRLFVTNNGEILSDESIDRLETARGKAEMLRSDLLARGWREDHDEHDGAGGGGDR